VDCDRSVNTEDAELQSDRVLAQRGTTPLRTCYEDDKIPLNYHGSHYEYREMLRRGATRLMIATFNMGYHAETGLVVWADETLYQRWTKDPMKKGDFWKIMLGRRIRLSPDDLDGSEWMDDFLDDIFGPQAPVSYKTFEESPGIWVTMPNAVGLRAAERDFMGESPVHVRAPLPVVVPPDFASDCYTESESDDVDMDGGKHEDGTEDAATEEIRDPVKHEDDYETDGSHDDNSGTQSDEEILYLADEPESTDQEEDVGNDKREPLPRNEHWETHMPVAFQPDSDSDRPGSDWDSDEILSGDEHF